jgi:molybdopterin synthase catalytic subunit
LAVEIRIQQADFSVAQEWEALRARAGGAIGAAATFVGLVRDRDDASKVTGLYLEHYPGMTERSIAEIVAEAQARWPVQDIVAIHRVGRLAPGDQIVFVQVASAHRAAAFAACEFVMDFLKTEAVFWKREHIGDEARWIEATGTDQSRTARWQNNQVDD